MIQFSLNWFRSIQFTLIEFNWRSFWLKTICFWIPVLWRGCAEMSVRFLIFTILSVLLWTAPELWSLQDTKKWVNFLLMFAAPTNDYGWNYILQHRLAEYMQHHAAHKDLSFLKKYNLFCVFLEGQRRLSVASVVQSAAWTLRFLYSTTSTSSLVMEIIFNLFSVLLKIHNYLFFSCLCSRWDDCSIIMPQSGPLYSKMIHGGPAQIIFAVMYF